MDSTTIQLVVFDLGGVLVELTGVPSMMAWTQHAFTEDEIWQRWIASPAGHAFEKGLITPREFARRLMTEFGMALDPLEFLAGFVTWAERPFPGAAELVAAVAGRCRLACLSNTNVLHWDRLIHATDLLRPFTYHFPSHTTGLLKPDPRAFANVIERTRTTPSRILYLDDNPTNVAAAATAGMRAIRAEGANGARTALIAAGVLEGEAGSASLALSSRTGTRLGP